MKKRHTFLLTVAVLFIASGVLWMRDLPAFLTVNDTLVNADVIIVPSGNEQAKRLDYAIYLYKQGFAPKVLLCGELALAKETGLNLGKLYLTSRGVPEEAVLSEQDSRSTFENALFTRPIVEREKFASAILVTYPLHTRRSKLIFTKAYPRSVRIAASCNRADFEEQGWWRDRNRSRDVAYEIFALVWNKVFGT